jgi:hypothetical protein
MKTLKIWSGRYLNSGVQTIGIVAAYTKKKAMELAGINYNEITDYWSLTGNKHHLAIAKEEGFWVTEKDTEYKDSPTYIRKK